MWQSCSLALTLTRVRGEAAIFRELAFKLSGDPGGGECVCGYLILTREPHTWVPFRVDS